MKKKFIIILSVFFILLLTSFSGVYVFSRHMLNSDAAMAIALTLADEVNENGVIDEKEINNYITRLVENSRIHADISTPDSPKDLFGSDFKILLSENKVTCISPGLFGRFFSAEHSADIKIKTNFQSTRT